MFSADLFTSMETAKRLIAAYPNVDIPALVRIAADCAQPEAARIAAIYTLAFTDDEGVSRPTLRNLVEQGETSAIREYAADALWEIGDV